MCALSSCEYECARVRVRARGRVYAYVELVALAGSTKAEDVRNLPGLPEGRGGECNERKDQSRRSLSAHSRVLPTRPLLLPVRGASPRSCAFSPCGRDASIKISRRSRILVASRETCFFVSISWRTRRTLFVRADIARVLLANRSRRGNFGDR